jgi:hypothetical protein
MKKRLIAIVMVTAAACGGDETLTELDGVYEVASWKTNAEGCDVPGPEDEFRPAFLFVRGEQFVDDLVRVAACTTLDECLLRGRDTTLRADTQFELQEGSDAAGWLGVEISASSAGANCNATRRLTTMVETATGLEISQRDSDISYPRLGETCSEAEAEQKTVGAPCVRSQLVDAKFAMPF